MPAKEWREKRAKQLLNPKTYVTCHSETSSHKVKEMSHQHEVDDGTIPMLSAKSHIARHKCECINGRVSERFQPPSHKILGRARMNGGEHPPFPSTWSIMNVSMLKTRSASIPTILFLPVANSFTIPRPHAPYEASAPRRCPR